MEEKKTASAEIRMKNRSGIYRLLLEGGARSRQDIVAGLRLSLPTVTQNLAELQREGLAAEAGSVGNTGGRRAKTYSAVMDARIALGLDVTRNHITAVAVDLSGTVIGKLRVREPFSKTDGYYRRLGEVVGELAAGTRIDPKRILGVGIGVPGLITPDNERVFYGKILNFTGTTRAEFSRYIPFRTALYNDANAAGFAEAWVGGIRNAFYIMLSNNVGGAVYLGDRQYFGENTKSGEVGHMTIVPGGRPCYCGQRGCVDSYCAATVLSDAADGDLGAFFAGLNSGNDSFRTLWDEYLLHLADTVNSLRMLFDCSIILGGYVGGYIEPYLGDLRRLAAERNPFEDNADYLIPCRWKTESIAAGAALNYISGFILSV